VQLLGFLQQNEKSGLDAKKKLIIMALLLVQSMQLTACGDADSAQSPNEDSSLPQEMIPDENMDTPDIGEGQTPSGIMEDSGDQDTTPSEYSEVSWDEALTILNNGDVRLVSQSHDLQVSLLLKNGRTITTTQPRIDAIFEAIRACGETCSDVIQMSE
jgi:hypothetical protein